MPIMSPHASPDSRDRRMRHRRPRHRRPRHGAHRRTRTLRPLGRPSSTVPEPLVTVIRIVLALVLVGLTARVLRQWQVLGMGEQRPDALCRHLVVIDQQP